MDYDEHDEELKDLLNDFEGALRHHLKTSEEFQTLVDYLAKKQGTISLYVAAQIMGPHLGTKKKRKRAQKTPPPLSFEMTKNDLDFLRSLHICPDL